LSAGAAGAGDFRNLHAPSVSCGFAKQQKLRRAPRKYVFFTASGNKKLRRVSQGNGSVLLLWQPDFIANNAFVRLSNDYTRTLLASIHPTLRYSNSSLGICQTLYLQREMQFLVRYDKKVH